MLVISYEQLSLPVLKRVCLWWAISEAISGKVFILVDDQDLIQHYMRDPSSVFLVVRPFEIGICMAGFFFWDQDRLQTDASELEVPLIRGIEPTGAEAETSGDGGLRRSRTSNPVGPDLEQIRSGGTGNLESSAASNSVREQARTQARNSQISQPALNVDWCVRGSLFLAAAWRPSPSLRLIG